MRRNTDTEKWEDPWFRKLSETHKLFWLYVNDHCDHAGVWKNDVDLASFKIGAKIEINPEHFLDATGSNRIEVLENGNWWLPGYIASQINTTLSPGSMFHKKTIAMLVQHGLIERYILIEMKLYGETQLNKRNALKNLPALDDTPLDTLPDTLSLGLDVEEESTRVGAAKKILAHLNKESGRDFSISDRYLKLIEARLGDVKDDAKGIMVMITRWCKMWKGSSFEEYLAPNTLFAPTKFMGRYDLRNTPLPLPQTGGPRVQTRVDHKKGF